MIKARQETFSHITRVPLPQCLIREDWFQLVSTSWYRDFREGEGGTTNARKSSDGERKS